LLLFNMAQSMRLKGDCPAASSTYRRYLLAAPAALNRSRVEQWLTELAPCSGRIGAVPPVADSVAIGPKPAVVLREAPPHRGRRAAGLVLVAAAVAAAGGAGYFSYVAHEAQNELTDRHRDTPGFLDQTAYDRGSLAASLARVLGVTSAAALVGGVLMLSRSSGKERAAESRIRANGPVVGSLGAPYLGWRGEF
jgi:hypothetical protein